MRREIIEFGIVEANAVTGELIREKSYLVRPAVSEISAFCTELTGITAEGARHGRLLGEVLRTIGKEFGLTKSIVTWGNDSAGLDRCCREAQVENSLESHRFINIGQLVSLMAGQDRRLGLYEVMEMLGVGETGRRHSGLDDARNTMLAYIEVSRRLRLDLAHDATPQLSI